MKVIIQENVSFDIYSKQGKVDIASLGLQLDTGQIKSYITLNNIGTRL